MRASALAVAILVSATMACGSGESWPGSASDAGSVPEAAADLGVPAADLPVLADAGAPVLYPTAGAPPPAGDGRLADVTDDSPGGTPDGWDLCGAAGLLPAPREGKGDPQAVRGDRYLVYRTEDAQRAPAGPSLLAQAYFYFDPPASLTDKGLWIDFVRISGTPARATFTLYSVDEVCQGAAVLGTFSLDPLLEKQGAWATTCVRLPAGISVGGLGFRLDAPDAEIGVDAFRFGPACPQTP
jgi:hypothetical protein